MERRYGRSTEKYRTKINRSPKKAETEKVIALQSGVCAVLLAAGVLVSYIGGNSVSGRYIKEVLYKSNTLSDWKAVFSPAMQLAKTGGQKTLLVINGGAGYLSEKLNFKFKAETSEASVKARADKTAAKQKKSEKTVEKVEKEVKTSDDQTEETVVFKVPTYGEITSEFGSRIHPVSGSTLTHTGIDIAAPMGQTVISAAKGRVSATGSDNANGNYVVVEHSGGYTTVYAHLSKISVSSDEWVDDNTKIGEVGSSGISTGPHLHFEVKMNNESVNPENYITLPHRKGE